MFRNPLLTSDRVQRAGFVCFAVLAGALGGGALRPAAAVVPPGNTVAQWNQIAENTVVGSGAFQNEGLIYMGYVSAAVYNATVAIHRSYAPYGAGVYAPYAYYMRVQQGATDQLYSDPVVYTKKRLY